MSETARMELSLDDGQATWNQLSECLDALARRWQAGGHPPDLAEFAPPGPPTLRRMALAELIKADIEFRGRRKIARRIEDYRAEFPEIAGPAGIPADLIYAEFHARELAGEDVSTAEYLDRFPAQATELRRLFAAGTAPQVTVMAGERPHEIPAGGALDDFDLLTILGEGAFARVFLARQRSMQRLVALKVSADRGDESRTLAQLDHPYIVRVYDQRVLPERGLRLLYMPYLPGGTLQEVVRLVRKTAIDRRSGAMLPQAVDEALAKRGEVPPTDSPTRQMLSAMTWPDAVCWLGARLGEALDSAHRLGVLHRDVKPANVLLGADAAPRLADFNVSVCTKLEGASPAAFFGGSVGYMSPEQLEAFHPAHDRRPDDLDGRADVYALAVTLWELLTGSRPFPDEQIEAGWSETLDAMLNRRRAGLPPAALAAFPADAPPGLRDVLVRALAADRDARFLSAGAFARQLDLCLKPRTRALLLPSPGWRTWVRHRPMFTMYALGLIPNLLASWFSIVYNDRAILSPFPTARPMFRLLQGAINGSFFPLGILLFGFLIWPVAAGLRRLSAGPVPPADLAALRRQTLRLGPGSVLVCFWLWVVSGVIFPVALHLAVQELPFDSHLHFLASQTLCGLIAVSYPLFGMTFVAVRAIYPAFWSAGPLPPADVRHLKWIERALGWSLVVAASVPMLAVGLLAGIRSENHLALGVLSVIGVAGLAVAYLLTSAVRADVAALTE